MRNLGFGLALAAVVVGGAAIGWYGAPGGVTALFSSQAERGPLDGLDFTVDSTATLQKTDGRREAAREWSGRPEDLPSCSMPRAGDAEVVMFGVYEGQSLSTVALGSPDEVTTVVDVVVEPGDAPLYIVLSAYDGLIWRFSGATDRVQRAVLVAGGEASSRGWSALAGAVGLSPEVVTTASYERCFKYVYQPGTPEADAAAVIVRRATGNEPSVVAGHYDPAAVRLPSGLVAKADGERRPTPPGFDRGHWREMLRFNPGGLIRIDASTVVSEADVVDYDVLPQEAGLAQLVGSGALVPTPDGLKIVEPIARFPAGLAGAHSTSFVVGGGIGLPKGDPGHSCVRMEATGRPPSALRNASRCDR